jgi:protein TonB
LLNNLLESKPQKQRTTGGMIFSVVWHAAVIALAVKATMNAAQKKEKREEKIDFVEVKKDEPPPPKEKPPENVVVAPPPPQGFQVLTAPVNIPDVLPDIDLTKKLTNEADFSGKGVAGGRANGVVGGVVADPNQTYFEFQVEKPAAQAPNSQTPRYPDMLKTAGVEGEVLAQFIVDTTGRVEPGSFKVLKTSHELFAAAVRNALPNMKFLPAEAGGRKVKQVVQQPFVFAIQK